MSTSVPIQLPHLVPAMQRFLDDLPEIELEQEMRYVRAVAVGHPGVPKFLTCPECKSVYHTDPKQARLPADGACEHCVLLYRVFTSKYEHDASRRD